MMNLQDKNGKKIQKMVKVNLHCGFDQIWEGQGCGLIGGNGEEQTAIKEQLQRNTQLNLKGMRLLVTYANCFFLIFLLYRCLKLNAISYK